MALVGESGSGKTLSALSMLCLVPEPGRIVSGEIMFEGRDILHLGPRELQALRGNEISMIFQEPMTSLNPAVHLSASGSARRSALHQQESASRSPSGGCIVVCPGDVGIADPGRRARLVPASAFGRHAAAGDDRDGPLVRARAADSRRADDRARRHDPGAILDLIWAAAEAAGMAMLMITHDWAIVAESGPSRRST